jgi:hypothetical protein
MRTRVAMGALLMFSVEMHKDGPWKSRKYDEGTIMELARFISSGLESEPAVSAAMRPPLSQLIKIKK